MHTFPRVLTGAMTSSPPHGSPEAEPVEQPSPAASRVSTLTDPWSEDEDDDDDGGGGVGNSLELVSASKELARDADDAEEDDEEGFDLVNSRDLRSPSPVSLVSTSSRNLVPTAPSPHPTTVTSSASEDLVKVLRQEEPAEGATGMQPDTDTESWRSSSSASDCSASIGGGTTNTKSSVSASGSESGRSHDDSADDHAAGAMRLSFPDPIAASLSGHEATAAHDQHLDNVTPTGLGADYSMLLDVTEAASADSTDSQASSSSAAASVPASPLSDTSRQLSEMSISPDKPLLSPSSSALSSAGANSSDQVVDDEMVSRSTWPLLMTTSTPPSPPSPHPRRTKQRQRRRSSSPTPLSRSDTSSAKQSLLVEQPYALDHDHEQQQQQQYGKSYDPAHVHDWIRSAAEASSPSSSPKPESDEEGQEEEAVSETDSLEQVSCAEDQAEKPPADMEQSIQQLEGGKAARQQQSEQEPAEHDLITSLVGPQSMTSSSATVVPGGRMAKVVPVADESLPGAMPESRGVTVQEAQAQQEEEDDDDAHSSSMQAYAHAPGTARSRKAVAVLSFVAAAVAIAATGWLDSTSSSSPAPVSTLPSSASASAPAMNCNAAATTTTTTTTEEVMLTFSETIRALMVETMVAGSEAEAGAGASATLITAMSIVRSDHNDHDDDDHYDEDDNQALPIAAESSCSCGAGSDQQPSAAIDTPPAPAPARVQEDKAPEPAAHPEKQTRGVFAPGTKLSELEELVVSRAQRRMHRHRQRRRGSLRRRRRELLSLFDRAAAPVVVHAPNPPVMYVPPAVDGPKRRRQVTAPAEGTAATDNTASSERRPESSWLSAWLRPSTADFVARVSTNVLVPTLKHGRHALESANHGRRKLARHLERDVATVAKDLQRQRERVNDFTARHRATCEWSPHLPECFLERLGHRSQRGAKSWWDSIRSHVGGGKRQDEVPRSWLDLIKRGRRKADTERVLDRAYARVARHLETLRLGTRRAQPLTYRGGQETVNHAREAVRALKRVGKRFSAWRRGETSRDGRRRKRNKSKNRSRRG